MICWVRPRRCRKKKSAHAMGLLNIPPSDSRIVEPRLSMVDIVEVFSPARVISACKTFGLKLGPELDLTIGFDLSLEIDRKRAWETFEREEPLFDVGSVPCTYFSLLQDLNKHIHRMDAEW